MLYDAKKIDMQVFVLCDKSSVKDTQYTVDSCANFVYQYPRTVVISEDTDAKLFSGRGFQTICGGKNRLTMIDFAMQNCNSDWAFFIDSGSKIQNRIDEKNSQYVNEYNNVIFPVFNRIYNFAAASLNGLLLNKKFYQEVGAFGYYDSIEITKLIWADKALAKGVKFKGIVGVRGK